MSYSIFKNRDDAEDVNGGFRKALSLHWDSAMRLLVHICDDPCHGKQFHSDDISDRFPDGVEGDDTWQNIFYTMIEKDIGYVFLKISDRTDMMISEFQKIYRKTLEDDEKLKAKSKFLTFAIEEIRLDS